MRALGIVETGESTVGAKPEYLTYPYWYSAPMTGGVRRGEVWVGCGEPCDAGMVGAILFFLGVGAWIEGWSGAVRWRGGWGSSFFQWAVSSLSSLTTAVVAHDYSAHRVVARISMTQYP